MALADTCNGEHGFGCIRTLQEKFWRGMYYLRSGQRALAKGCDKKNRSDVSPIKPPKRASEDPNRFQES